MALTVKLFAAPNMGSVIQGNSGTYSVASDGTFSADSRDVPALLAAGCVYVNAKTQYYTSLAVATAAVGKFVASTSLANGALAIANQPDVPRQARWIWGAGTVPITAGTVAISYTANDGTVTTQSTALALAASATATVFLAKGAIILQTPTVAGLVGGAAPFIQLDSTTAISVPIDFNTQDVTFIREWDDSTAQATVGTASTVTVGTITPQTAPNATHTFSFLYTQNTPDQ